MEEKRIETNNKTYIDLWFTKNGLTMETDENELVSMDDGDLVLLFNLLVWLKERDVSYSDMFTYTSDSLHDIIWLISKAKPQIEKEKMEEYPLRKD